MVLYATISSTSEVTSTCLIISRRIISVLLADFSPCMATWLKTRVHRAVACPALLLFLKTTWMRYVLFCTLSTHIDDNQLLMPVSNILANHRNTASPIAGPSTLSAFAPAPRIAGMAGGIGMHSASFLTDSSFVARVPPPTCPPSLYSSHWPLPESTTASSPLRTSSESIQSFHNAIQQVMVCITACIQTLYCLLIFLHSVRPPMVVVLGRPKTR